MRKINLRDTFAFARLIKEIGIKDEFLEMTEKANGYASLNQLGYDTIFNIIAVATEKKSEDRIYEWLSGPFEKPSDDVANMPLDEIIQGFKTILNMRGIKAFLLSASKLIT